MDDEVTAISKASSAHLVSRDSTMVHLASWLNDDNAVHKGFLSKQGQVVKSWKRRWFVLCNGTLQYFKEPEDDLARGEFQLFRGVAVEEWPPAHALKKGGNRRQLRKQGRALSSASRRTSSPTPSPPASPKLTPTPVIGSKFSSSYDMRRADDTFGFRLRRPGGKILLLRADTEHDRETWIDLLRTVIQSQEKYSAVAKDWPPCAVPGCTTATFRVKFCIQHWLPYLLHVMGEKDGAVRWTNIAAFGFRGERAVVQKCGRGVSAKGWHVRWMLVHDNVLFYFKEPPTNRSYPRGWLSIDRAFVSDDPGDLKGNLLYVFTILERATGRRYYFQAQTEQDYARLLSLFVTCGANFEANRRLDQMCVHRGCDAATESGVHCARHLGHDNDEPETRKLMDEAKNKVQATFDTEARRQAATDLLLFLRSTIRIQAWVKRFLVRRRRQHRTNKVIRLQARARGILARRMFEKMDKNRRRLRRIMGELLSTEVSYTAALKALVDVFVVAFTREAARNDTKRKLVEPSLVEGLFANVEEISTLHSRMIWQFEMLCSDSYEDVELSVLPLVGVLMESFCQELHVYTRYVNNYDTASALLARAMCKKDFVSFLEIVTRNNASQLEDRALTSFLIMPVQRIPRYIMLLQDCIDHVSDFYDASWKQMLENALQHCRKLALHVNEAKRDNDNTERLAVLAETYVKGFLEPLVIPERAFFLEVEARELVTVMPPESRERMLLLFSDMVMVTEKRIKKTKKVHKMLSKTFRFHYLYHISLNASTLTDLPDTNLSTFSIQLRTKAKPKDQERILCFATQKIKDTWCDKLSLLITNARRQKRR